VRTDAGIVPGWFDTVLPAGLRSIAVRVAGSEDVDAASQAVLSIDGNGAHAAFTRRLDDGVLLVYALDGGDAEVVVRTRNQDGIEVQAVLGLADAPETVGLAPVHAASYGVRLGGTVAPSSRVAIHMVSADIEEIVS